MGRCSQDGKRSHWAHGPPSYFEAFQKIVGPPCVFMIFAFAMQLTTARADVLKTGRGAQREKSPRTIGPMGPPCISKVIKKPFGPHVFSWCCFLHAVNHGMGRCSREGEGSPKGTESQNHWAHGPPLYFKGFQKTIGPPSCFSSSAFATPQPKRGEESQNHRARGPPSYSKGFQKSLGPHRFLKVRLPPCS